MEDSTCPMGGRNPGTGHLANSQESSIQPYPKEHTALSPDPPRFPYSLQQRFKVSAAEKPKGKRWPDCKGSTAETEKNKVKEDSRRRLLDFSPTL